MEREITLLGKTIKYRLEYKKVKNINLRIKPDLSVSVSASKRVGTREIEAFMASKAQFILSALEKFEAKEKTERILYFGEKEIRQVIVSLCDTVYPYFKEKGIAYPVIKFRKMKSRWGSCNYTKGIITFNTSLMYVPYECVQYVVLHEFCHFLQPNHSPLFYRELEAVCPRYKEYRKIMREISANQP